MGTVTRAGGRTFAIRRLLSLSCHSHCVDVFRSCFIIAKSSGYVNEVSAVVSCVFGSLLGVMRTVEHRQGLGSERGGEREARRRDTQSLSRNGGMFCDQNWTVQ